jgi:hypothetical protein
LFCPKCGTEYVEGVTTCTECGSPLTADPPAEAEGQAQWIDFQELLATFNAGDIAIIKSLLDAESIDYFFQGEFFNNVRPLIEPVRLMVRKDQVSEAKDILGDLGLEYALTRDVKEWTDE